jgi:hypothetical protein
MRHMLRKPHRAPRRNLMGRMNGMRRAGRQNLRMASRRAGFRGM